MIIRNLMKKFTISKKFIIMLRQVVALHPRLSHTKQLLKSINCSQRNHQHTVQLQQRNHRIQFSIRPIYFQLESFLYIVWDQRLQKRRQLPQGGFHQQQLQPWQPGVQDGIHPQQKRIISLPLKISFQCLHRAETVLLLIFGYQLCPLQNHFYLR